MATATTDRKEKIQADIEKLNKRMAQLKAQKQAIESREKQKERKERTRRLIQKGAICETFFQSTNQSVESFEDFLIDLVKLPGVQKFIDDAAAAHEKETAPA